MNYFDVFLCIILSYIYGAIPWSYVLTYILKKQKLTELGSKSTGVQNTFTSAGLGIGIFNVIMEISKAILPIFLAFYIFTPSASISFLNFLRGDYNRHIAFFMVSASFIGTNFSAFNHFKGGMGFTITIWAQLLLLPMSFVITASSLLIVTGVNRSYTKANLKMEKSKFLIPVLYLVSSLLLKTTRPYWWSATFFGTVIALTYYLKRHQNLEEIRVITTRTFNPQLRKLKSYYKSHPRYVFFLEELGSGNNFGNKGYNVFLLHQMGFKVPETLIISYSAFTAYKTNRDKLLADLSQELSAYILEGVHYSIRSSANVEDAIDFSYAGQFETFLNIQSLDIIMQKIQEIWEASIHPDNQTYKDRLAKSIEDVQVGILIQAMIHPIYAGVVFTRDPVYNLNEIIIELVNGSGVSLVQKGVTPERWIFKWNQWVPDPDETKIKIFSDLIKDVQKIERKYGKPVDLEFVFDGHNIYYLQLREITTIKSPKLYSNKISKEFLPGMIKPLIFSVNTPIVNGAWKKIFTQLIGFPAKRIRVEELTKSFYYHAYFNMGIIGDIFQVLGMPRDFLEILAGINTEGVTKPRFQPSIMTLRYLPRFFIFVLRMLFLDKEIENHLRVYRVKYNDLEQSLSHPMKIDQLRDNISELFQMTSISSYYVILSQILNSIYSKIIHKKIEGAGLKIDDFDLTSLNKNLKYQDFRFYLQDLHNLYEKLPENLRLHYFSPMSPKTTPLKKNAEFETKLLEFLAKFGYLRDNGNDFSLPSWNETPEIIQKMLHSYKIPSSNKFDSQKTREVIQSIFSSPISKWLLNKAIKYQEYRATVNQLYMFGYGLFRPLFMKFAEKLSMEGKLSQIDDIFYLKYAEIMELGSKETNLSNLSEKVELRRREMKKYKNIQLPEILYDDTPPEPIEMIKGVEELKGVPTSRGLHLGRAKIAQSLDDYDKIKEGDVLVIPYSDVSWTPLFTKAKAVISESGGILSHCSIVAREYKIPAIVSVSGAMNLHDNMMLLVDGNTGKISIIDNTSEED